MVMMLWVMSKTALTIPRPMDAVAGRWRIPQNTTSTVPIASMIAQPSRIDRGLSSRAGIKIPTAMVMRADPHTPATARAVEWAGWPVNTSISTATTSVVTEEGAIELVFENLGGGLQGKGL